mmetsp:Transcript_19678/g.48372  ORF Transcript_19678/g.48372 Transcript_19678/m.48372 type:complete len:254 (+) Transcript_19678:417-1178(+)
MSATSSSFSFTTGSFPFLLSFSILFASPRLTPSFADVNWPRGVMNSFTLTEISSMKDVSRLEIIPTNLPPIFPLSVTGNDENPRDSFVRYTSSKVLSGLKQTGSRMNPFLNFFTRLTSAAWSSGFMFEWIIPIPPCSAIVIAILCSVTVSMGEETNGTCSSMLRVSLVEMSTSPSAKEMCPGMTITSSYVYATQAGFFTKTCVAVYPSPPEFRVSSSTSVSLSLFSPFETYPFAVDMIPLLSFFLAKMMGRDK